MNLKESIEFVGNNKQKPAITVKKLGVVTFNECKNLIENNQLDNEGNIAYDIVGIKGHGVVAIDTTPWRAYEHIERLEHICKIVLASGKY